MPGAGLICCAADLAFASAFRSRSEISTQLSATPGMTGNASVSCYHICFLGNESEDGFCTVDVSLSELRISGTVAPPGRYLRIELEPNTPARAVCGDGTLKQFTRVKFSGPVLIDTDAFPPSWSPFLEIHPLDDFQVIATGSLPVAAPPAQIAWPMVTLCGRVTTSQFWRRRSTKDRTGPKYTTQTEIKSKTPT